MQRPAQDLKCGDVFLYREQRYLVLLNFIDERHTLATITAILESDYNEGQQLKQIFGLRLLRPQHLEVVAHHYSLKLIGLDAQTEELTSTEERELALLIQAASN